MVMVGGNFGVFSWGWLNLFCVFLVWGFGFTFFVFVRYLIGGEYCFLVSLCGFLGWVGLSFRRYVPFSFVVVLVLTGLVLVLPTPVGLSYDGQKALAAFVFTGLMFALQPVPLPFAGLMVPVLLVGLGLADSAGAFNTLSRPIIILILGSLFLAEALRKHGVTRRLAQVAIISSGGRVSRLLLSLMGIAALLSMWMENTATAAVLIPVALTISNQLEDKDEARELLMLLVLGIAYGASMGGMATVTGSASNAVASEFLSSVRVWTFLDWMMYGGLSLVLVFPVTWLALSRSMKVRVSVLDIERTRQEYAALGAMRGVEKEILGVLGAAIVLWIAGSRFEDVFALPGSFLSPAVVGVIAVSYLSVRGIIEWEDVRGVSWGMFFAISAGLALGEALVRAGTTDWFTVMVAPVFEEFPFIVGLVLVVVASALLTNMVNNATVVAVFTPILIELAAGNPAFNAVALVMPLTLATTFGYALPSASGRMALISATGYVDRGIMFRYGMLMALVGSVLLIAEFYVLWLLGWV